MVIKWTFLKLLCNKISETIFTLLAIVSLLYFFHITRYGLKLRGLITYYTSSTLKPQVFKKTKHNFLISLTTSPERLRLGLEKTLRCFSGPILLNLPQLYHNNESYDEHDIQKISKSMPNLIIHRVATDFGPQTKLLGALTYYGLSNYDGVIVVDDDTEYAFDMVNVYDDDFDNETIFSAKPKTYFGIDIAPGCESFCVPVQKLSNLFFNLDTLYSNCSSSCARHDDMVFGAIFQDLGLKIKQTSRQIEIVQLDIGYGFDALHNIENNASKHVKCSQAIWDLRKQCFSSLNATDIFMKLANQAFF